MIHKIKLGHNLLWFGSTGLYVVGFVIFNICHIYFLCYIIKTLNAYQYIYTAFCNISLIFSSGILQIRCHLESLMLQIEDLLIINKTHFFNILKIELPINFMEFTKFSKFLILSSSTKMSPTSSQVVSGNATLTIITLFKILASNYLYSYQVHQSIHVHGIYL